MVKQVSFWRKNCDKILLFAKYVHMLWVSWARDRRSKKCSKRMETILVWKTKEKENINFVLLKCCTLFTPNNAHDYAMLCYVKCLSVKQVWLKLNNKKKAEICDLKQKAKVQKNLRTFAFFFPLIINWNR